MANDHVTKNFETEVFQPELELLRGKDTLDDSDDPLVGLALSGGGIRSAAFCTGVLQQLANQDHMRHFDYMSTVSGGGYCGTSLNWFLHEKNAIDGKKFGLGPADFPFAESETQYENPDNSPPQIRSANRNYEQFQNAQYTHLANKVHGKSEKTVTEKKSLIDFIRHRASYLQLSKGVSGLGIIAKAARSVIFSLLIYFISCLGVFILLHAALTQIDRSYDPHTLYPATKEVQSLTFANDTKGRLSQLVYPAQLAYRDVFKSSVTSIACGQAPDQADPEDPKKVAAFKAASQVYKDCLGKQDRYLDFAAIMVLICSFTSMLLLIAYGYKAYQTSLYQESLAQRYSTRQRSERKLGVIVTCILTSGFLAAIYVSIAKFGMLSPQSSMFQVLVGLLGAVGTRLWTLSRNEFVSGYWLKILIWGSGTMLILGIVSTSILVSMPVLGWLDRAFARLAEILPILSQFNSSYFVLNPYLAMFVIVLCFAGFLRLCHFPNINLFGLHGLYANRLMETFLPSASTALYIENSGRPISGLPGKKQKMIKGDLRAAEVGLSQFRIDPFVPGGKGYAGKSPSKPLQIINTNLVLTRSLNRKFAGRGGDSFALTALKSGSSATGWVDSHHLGMTLPAAMAVSGAAVNPRTMPDAKGSSHDGMLAVLMTLLNIRLGYWISNCFKDPTLSADMEIPDKTKPPTITSTPNFITPGLSYGLLSKGTPETRSWLELTDGGHFDNTGLYELIRRKVSNIVLVDGSADPDLDFASFANAFELARSDFGVDVRFDDVETDFNGMFKSSSKSSKPISKTYQTAERGFAIGKIFYPPDTDGVRLQGNIFYIKTVLCDGLRANLYSYHATHTKFPDEPTSDQFFNEQQFEVYRMLGEDIAGHMLDYLKRRYPKDLVPYPFGPNRS